MIYLLQMRPTFKFFGYTGSRIQELRPILKLLSFLLPRAAEVWKKELEEGHIILLPFQVSSDWEKHRRNEEVVRLFYDTLNHMNIKVPDYLREPELDWALFLRIMDFHNPKSGSFVDLAEQLGISKETLKKVLNRVDPKLAMKLRNRKKLSLFESYEITEILGVYKDIVLDEEYVFLNSSFIYRSEMYSLLYTDKKTLESNLSEPLKQRIHGLNVIPPILFMEVRNELDGTVLKKS